MAPPHPFLAPGGSRAVPCVTFRPPLAGLRWMEPQIEVVREVRGWLGRSKRRSGDDVLQRVLHGGTTAAFANQDSDAWTIDRRPHRRIHR